jgi:hypothetical protein
VHQANWLKRQWRVLISLIAFTLFAPVGLFALPLAALLMMSQPQRTRVTVIAIIVGGFSLAWILQPGDLPEQVVRAGAVIAMTVFVPLTLYTRTWTCNRICLSASAAALSVTMLLLALGHSWHELHWWVEHRAGYAARILMRSTWGREGSADDAGQIANILSTSVRFVAEYHPALVTLQVMAGLALATIIYQRLATKPRGVPPGRFRDFRFTEHVGWAAIAALIIVTVPKFAAVKLGAMNVLAVLGALYALRGVAVATTGIMQLGGGYVITVLSTALAFLLLPAAIVGAILLGIVDTSFDLRTRWQTPQAGG